MNGLITSIQRFSTQDGPGIRTTVFFKGCNMECRWCHNPESINSKIEIGVNEDRCIACSNCIKTCDLFALTIKNEKICLDRSLCNGCLECVDECFCKALIYAGDTYSVDSLVSLILEDRIYYKNSNGGVTFSGGEPLLQTPFLLEVIKRLKKENINIIVETNLSLDLDESLLELVDCFYVDIKNIDSLKHKEWTRISNEKIFKNIKLMDSKDINIKFRTPIIPDFNDSLSDVKKIYDFVKSLKNNFSYTLIPYHPLGLIKYKQFGIKVRYDNKSFLNEEKFNSLIKYVENNNNAKL